MSAIYGNNGPFAMSGDSNLPALGGDVKQPQLGDLASFAALIAASIGLAFFPSLPTLSLMALLTFATATRRVAIGVAGWILATPLEYYVFLATNITPFSVLTPALLVGVAIHGSLRSGWALRDEEMRFLLLFSAVMAASIVLSQYLGSDSLLRFSISPLLLCLVMLLIVVTFRRDHQAMWYIGHAVIFGTVLAAIVGWTFADVTWRLGVGDSVRQLANAVGLSLTLLIATHISSKRQRAFQALPFSRHPLMRIGLIFLLLLILAATVSRGVILALLTVNAALGVMLFGSVHARRNGKLATWGITTGMLAIVGVAVAIYIDRVLASGHLIGRILLAVSDPGDNLRWAIWGGTIGNMGWKEWLIGSGPGTFRELALDAGFDYYAHSVFIDAWVTLGMLGIAVLTVFVVRASARAWRTGNLAGLALTVYTVISFSTHGSLFSKAFWLSLGIAYGLASVQRQDTEGMPFRARVNVTQALRPKNG